MSITKGTLRGCYLSLLLAKLLQARALRTSMPERVGAAGAVTEIYRGRYLAKKGSFVNKFTNLHDL